MSIVFNPMEGGGQPGKGAAGGRYVMMALPEAIAKKLVDKANAEPGWKL